MGKSRRFCQCKGVVPRRLGWAGVSALPWCRSCRLIVLRSRRKKVRMLPALSISIDAVVKQMRIPRLLSPIGDSVAPKCVKKKYMDIFAKFSHGNEQDYQDYREDYSDYQCPSYYICRCGCEQYVHNGCILHANPGDSMCTAIGATSSWTTATSSWTTVFVGAMETLNCGSTYACGDVKVSASDITPPPIERKQQHGDDSPYSFLYSPSSSIGDQPPRTPSPTARNNETPPLQGDELDDYQANCTVQKNQAALSQSEEGIDEGQYIVHMSPLPPIDYPCSDGYLDFPEVPITPSPVQATALADRYEDIPEVARTPSPVQPTALADRSEVASTPSPVQPTALADRSSTPSPVQPTALADRSEVARTPSPVQPTALADRLSTPSPVQPTALADRSEDIREVVRPPSPVQPAASVNDGYPDFPEVPSTPSPVQPTALADRSEDIPEVVRTPSPVQPAAPDFPEVPSTPSPVQPTALADRSEVASVNDGYPDFPEVPSTPLPVQPTTLADRSEVARTPSPVQPAASVASVPEVPPQMLESMEFDTAFVRDEYMHSPQTPCVDELPYPPCSPPALPAVPSAYVYGSALELPAVPSACVYRYADEAQEVVTNAGIKEAPANSVEGVEGGSMDVAEPYYNGETSQKCVDAAPIRERLEDNADEEGKEVEGGEDLSEGADTYACTEEEEGEGVDSSPVTPNVADSPSAVPPGLTVPVETGPSDLNIKSPRVVLVDIASSGLSTPRGVQAPPQDSASPGTPGSISPERGFDAYASDEMENYIVVDETSSDTAEIETGTRQQHVDDFTDPEIGSPLPLYQLASATATCSASQSEVEEYLPPQHFCDSLQSFVTRLAEKKKEPVSDSWMKVKRSLDDLFPKPHRITWCEEVEVDTSSYLVSDADETVKTLKRKKTPLRDGASKRLRSGSSVDEGTEYCAEHNNEEAEKKKKKEEEEEEDADDVSARRLKLLKKVDPSNSIDFLENVFYEGSTPVLCGARNFVVGDQCTPFGWYLLYLTGGTAVLTNRLENYADASVYHSVPRDAVQSPDSDLFAFAQRINKGDQEDSAIKAVRLDVDFREQHDYESCMNMLVTWDERCGADWCVLRLSSEAVSYLHSSRLPALKETEKVEVRVDEVTDELFTVLSKMFKFQLYELTIIASRWKCTKKLVATDKIVTKIFKNLTVLTLTVPFSKSVLDFLCDAFKRYEVGHELMQVLILPNFNLKRISDRAFNEFIEALKMLPLERMCIGLQQPTEIADDKLLTLASCVKEYLEIDGYTLQPVDINHDTWSETPVKFLTGKMVIEPEHNFVVRDKACWYQGKLYVSVTCECDTTAYIEYESTDFECKSCKSVTAFYVDGVLPDSNISRNASALDAIGQFRVQNLYIGPIATSTDRSVMKFICGFTRVANVFCFVRGNKWKFARKLLSRYPGNRIERICMATYPSGDRIAPAFSYAVFGDPRDDDLVLTKLPRTDSKDAFGKPWFSSYHSKSENYNVALARMTCGNVHLDQSIPMKLYRR